MNLIGIKIWMILDILTNELMVSCLVYQEKYFESYPEIGKVFKLILLEADTTDGSERANWS